MNQHGRLIQISAINSVELRNFERSRESRVCSFSSICSFSQTEVFSRRKFTQTNIVGASVKINVGEI